MSLTKLTRLLLIAFILSLSLGQLGRLPGGGFFSNLYLYDILLVTLILCWIVWVTANLARIGRLSLSPLWWLGILFALWSLVTLVVSYAYFGSAVFNQGFFYWTRWVLYFCLFPIGYMVTTSQSQPVRLRNRNLVGYKERLLGLLVFSGVLVAIFGFVQLIVFPDFTSMAVSGGWDPHRNRLVSTFFDPNFTGAYLAICFLLVVPQALAKGKSSLNEGGRVRVIKVLSLVVIATALLLTFSRSAWGMLAVGIGVIGLFKYRWLLVLGALVAFSAYFFIPRVQTRLVGITDSADSAAHRLVSWQKTLDIYQEYPWWGTGFGNFRLAQKESGYFTPGEWGGRSGAGSDSSVLLVLATTGPIGLIFYLSMYGYIMYKGWAAFRYSTYPGFQALGLSLLAITSGLVLESNFINSLFYSQIMAFLWILVGLFEVDQCDNTTRDR